MNMENKILRGLMWTPESGRLSFREVRYLLIRPETVVAVQKAAEEALGERAGELFYAGGFAGGSLSSRRYKEAFGYSDRQIVDFMCRMGRQIGWGRFEVVELDDAAGRLVVDVYDSPFAEAYGPADHAVCHLIRGVLAGLASGLFQADVEAVESPCAAQGAARCHFAIQRKRSSTHA
ncbi:MAG: hypothetical protein D6723_15565 [Acidobacteria bacterium]|nr:MAG: hypothetical protein D6723_15565 [Acidobacteriota bacterium]